MKRASIAGAVLIAALAFGLLLSGALLAQQDTSSTPNRATVQQTYHPANSGPTNGRPNWQGHNFIDENGNGICDRLEAGQRLGPQARHGMAHGGNFFHGNGHRFGGRHAVAGRHMGFGHWGGGDVGFGPMHRGQHGGWR